MASNPPPNRPLRDALLGGDSDDPVDLITGVVKSRQSTTAPWSVTVQLAEGTITEAIPFLAAYNPRVNDVVYLLRKGPALLVLGAAAPALTTVSPHRHAAADVDGTIIATPPTPAAPPAGPPPPPTVRTVGIAPDDQAYWSAWGWKGDDLIQGGPANRAFWFYGGKIAAAKGGGTITGGSIYVERRNTSHGVGGAANVRLGVHGYGTRPGSGGAGHGAVSVQAQLGRGQSANVPLSAAQIAALNAGSPGLGLEPGGSSYSSPDYLRAVIGGASGQLSLTIQG